jgi:hypothetical protein
MFRVLVALGAAYGLGHPALDAYRPAALDRPLHGFYYDVNAAVIQCERAVKSFDGERIKYYLGRAGARMEAEMHR